MRNLFLSLIALFRSGPALEVAIHHVLRADSVLTGTLQFSGGLSVEGRVQGQLMAQGPKTGVVVGKDAEVITEHLKADTVLIHGRVIAKSIQAKKVVLTAAAFVEGDIDAEAFEVHTGAQFRGQVLMRGVPKAATEPVAPRSDSAGTAKARLQAATQTAPVAETA